MGPQPGDVGKRKTMSPETHSQMPHFIWGICNLLRGPYKRNEYRKVILPLTVLRRFDCLLAATKDQVLDLDELSSLDQNVIGFGYNRLRPVAIHDQDYLDATSDPIPMKLRRCLQERNVPCDFERVTLVTSPRYFHYAFKPVSFYLCYGAQDKLECFLMEVNNTFKERHVYIVDQLHRANGHWQADHRQPKQFHVSPFNDMDGEYATQITDNSEELDIRIDLFRRGDRIFLSQLQARTQPLTSFSMWRTITQYPVRALATFPRILWEAARLAYQRKLPVFPKPTPCHALTVSTRSPTLIQRIAMRMVMRILGHVRQGRLRIVLPNGLVQEFGEIDAEAAEIRIRDYGFFTRILTHGRHSNRAPGARNGIRLGQLCHPGGADHRLPRHLHYLVGRTASAG